MKQQISIDDTLRAIGNAPPPPGLEQRVRAGLLRPRRRLTTVHAISAIAIAATLIVAVLALDPLTRELTLNNSTRMTGARLAIHPTRTFGGASAVKVPTAPIPVEPTPLNQGRGHARSDRNKEKAQETSRPLPHGVALPRSPKARVATPPGLSAQPAHPGTE